MAKLAEAKKPPLRMVTLKQIEEREQAMAGWSEKGAGGSLPKRTSQRGGEGSSPMVKDHPVEVAHWMLWSPSTQKEKQGPDSFLL